MTHEPTDINWDKEQSWSQQLNVALSSETVGSSYVSGLPSDYLKRLVENLMTKHEFTDQARDKLQSFVNKQYGNFIEFLFNRKDQGIGWCRIGFVLKEIKTMWLTIVFHLNWNLAKQIHLNLILQLVKL